MLWQTEREGETGGKISNRREPESCLGQVFNSKLGHIAILRNKCMAWHAATSRVENSAEGLSCQLNTQAYFLIVNAEVKLLHNIDTDVSTERDHRLSRRRRRCQREHGGTHQGSRRNRLCVSFSFFPSQNLLRPEPGQVGKKPGPKLSVIYYLGPDLSRV